ncbi:DUF1446-domain-containing protein [Mytilinidion resinicola]|uniref:DUF1446-domain-containing protein n=1 Tax=Mytilinidion resinicola TaxID=574789 RepID=A0A6A6YI23_9PEZI|nr:DUF1446-domain-containing protein [Mytilinidion resinicola]KAF2808486.1 DUF1446-domain-containing protein [Mytilinidion resinicola]
MGSVNPQRPVRVMNISGSPSDRRDAIAIAAASNEPIDVFVGDWMSEVNMTTRAYDIVNDLGVGYEPTFIDALEPALENIAKKKLKLAANAGTVATKELFDIVVSMVNEEGLDLNVAWVEGDAKGPSSFVSVCTGQSLADWPYEPIFAQCYLGGMGIAKTFGVGADIVICGRVADASPIIGAAAWRHGWAVTDFDKLAQSLIAGHLIECSTYVTGGNYTGFKSLDWDTMHDFGYPIAEISHDADVIITKVEGTGGIVIVETCKEQLLYEIQGAYYLNSDVTAVIDKAKFTEIGKNCVCLSGITGLPPPSTTKCGLTAFGGYKAEIHWALVGLDIEEKVKMLDIQMKHSYGKEWLSKFTTFDLTVYGSVERNPKNQNAATVDLRLVVESKDTKALSVETFIRPAFDIIMQSFPAATYHPDRRTASPIPYQEYFPTLIPQPTQTIHFSNSSMKSIILPPPSNTIPHKPQQPSYPPTSPGSNCNIGLFVRHGDEWARLRSFLSLKTFIELLGEEYHGQQIDHMEFEQLWAVHFLLHDWLDRGVTANATYDILGKFLAEYLRCKIVDVPNVFLERGKI